MSKGLEKGVTKSFHLCLSVRGAIKTSSRRQLASLFEGANADEAKDILLDQLAQGHEVLPIGPACEGFDYSGGGCPGHVEGVGDVPRREDH